MDWRFAIYVLGIVTILISCEPQESAVPPPPPAVVVASVERKDVTPSTDFNGRVEAVDKVELRARVEGFLQQRLFEEGSDVKAGDLMFVIEKAPYEANVTRATADLAQAQASLSEARASAARFRKAAKSGAVSQQQLDEAIAKEQVAEAQVLETQAKLQRAELDLSYTDVIAPVSGRIGRERYTVGNLVEPSSEPLATIVSQDPIYVTFPVSQRLILDYMRRKQRGEADARLKLNLRFADGTTYEYPGEIDFTDIQISQSTDTLTIRAVFPNPNGLLIDGQFVTVSVEKETPESELVVLRSAVQTDQAGRFVLFVNKDNVVERRRIETGQETGLEVVVNDGLKQGDRIIIEGIQKARAGQPVQPTEEIPPSAPKG